MSTSVVKQIIEQALDDESFRKRLFNHPDKVLADYDLTPEEIQKLKGLDEETFDDFAGPLTGRTTKGQWFPSL